MKNVKKTYELFLDDVRMPEDAFLYTRQDMFLSDSWQIVRNYDQFVEKIEMNWEIHQAFPSIIAFDHDLAYEHYMPQNLWGSDYDKWAEKKGFKEKTGYDCAKWLIEFCIDKELYLPEFFCHSMNPVGKDNINTLLKNFKEHQNG